MNDGVTGSIVGEVLPAARPLGDFATERIGDELILFDGSTMQYHSLNGVAEQIWCSCDGTSSIETIAIATGLPVETVETTIGELGEASLLAISAEKWSVPMTRRHAAKLIAAGAVGLPVVLSITAPHSASAASGSCPEGGDCVPIEGSCSPSSGACPCCQDPPEGGDEEGFSGVCERSLRSEEWICIWKTEDLGFTPDSWWAEEAVAETSDAYITVTDEQRKVLDSVQETLDRADNALNTSDQTESVIQYVTHPLEAEEYAPAESSSSESRVPMETASDDEELVDDQGN